MDPDDFQNLTALIAAGRRGSWPPPTQPQSDQERMADALMAYRPGAGAAPSPSPQDLADALMAWKPGGASPAAAAPPAPDQGAGDVDLGSYPLRPRPQSDAVLIPVVDTRLIQPGRAPELRQATQAPAQPLGPWQPDPSAIQTQIDPIPGYPQTGENAWRAQNDQIFLDAVNDHNLREGLRPGDPGYVTADRFKAQAMAESGGDKQAFLRDPLQMNKRGDGTPDKEKLTGLVDGQPMTPDLSARTALLWLDRKGSPADNAGRKHLYAGDFDTLKNYNARKTIDPNGVEHDINYANNILNKAKAAQAAGAGQAKGRGSP